MVALARTVLFLATDAAAVVTGAILAADGGQRLRRLGTE